MEYNSLKLFVKLDVLALKYLLIRLPVVLHEVGFKKSDLLPLSSLNADTCFKNLNACVNTEFFYVNSLAYDTRILFGCDGYNIYSKETVRWFELEILFKTADLAKDPNNNDFAMSDFEYSTKAKKIIKKLSKDLHSNFSRGYIFFTNEYNDGISMHNLEQIGEPNELYLPDDVEYANCAYK